MPTQDEVFASIISSVEAGAKSEEKELKESARDAIRKRYFDWIVEPGKNQQLEPVEPTPQDVWDEPQGAMFRSKFEEIGWLAAQESVSGEVAGEEINTASERIESDSDCPWCR